MHDYYISCHETSVSTEKIYKYYIVYNISEYVNSEINWQIKSAIMGARGVSTFPAIRFEKNSSTGYFPDAFRIIRDLLGGQTVIDEGIFATSAILVRLFTLTVTWLFPVLTRPNIHRNISDTVFIR